MPTRILVPLDVSNLAEQVLPFAVMLARGLSAELGLLPAVSLPADVQDSLVDSGLRMDEALAPWAADADRCLRQVAG